MRTSEEDLLGQDQAAKHLKASRVSQSVAVSPSVCPKKPVLLADYAYFKSGLDLERSSFALVETYLKHHVKLHAAQYCYYRASIYACLPACNCKEPCVSTACPLL